MKSENLGYKLKLRLSTQYHFSNMASVCHVRDLLAKPLCRLRKQASGGCGNNARFAKHASLTLFVNKLMKLILLTMLIVPLIAGCSQNQQEEVQTIPDVPGTTGSQLIDVYTIADATGDWGFPSPHGHYSRGPGILRMSFLFDTLIWKDARGYVPALAKSWTYLEDENAYLFELQQNVKWHDGEPFTAQDVAFTFSYLEKHPYSMGDVTAVAGVDILDDYQVKLRLKEPLAPFLNRIAGAIPILPEHIWESVENPADFTEAEGAIGTGPFKFSDYNREQGSYLFFANHDYYLGTPKVEQVKFIKLNPQLAGAALERGQINFTSILPDMVEDLENKDYTIIKSDYDWALKLLFNHTKEPLSNKEFRQGLAYAIDRQELVAISKRGFGLAGCPGLLSQTSPWHNPQVEPYEYNPDKGLELFASAGYDFEAGRLTKDGQPITFTLLFDPNTEREAQLIKQQLKIVGIELQLKSIEGKTKDAMILDWQFDLAIQGHGGLGADPAFYSQVIVGPSFNSARYTANEQLNSLLQEQLVTLDEKERHKIVGEIQRLYAEDMPCLTLYYPDNYTAHDGQIEFYNTWLGVATGVPSPLNKEAFVQGGGAY